MVIWVPMATDREKLFHKRKIRPKPLAIVKHEGERLACSVVDEDMYVSMMKNP